MERIFASVMNNVLLSIGTNEDREANLARCHLLLSDIFTSIRYSKTSITTPYGQSYKNNFLNQLAVAYTNKEQDDIIKLLKSIEKELGRDKADKAKGIVKIDVDLVKWNEEILKPAEMTRNYIAELLPELEELLP